MDDCGAVLKRLYPYLDGELNEEDRCRVHTHLLGCLTCQDTFDAERSFLHLFRATAATSPSPLTARTVTEFLRHGSSEAEPPTPDRPR